MAVKKEINWGILGPGKIARKFAKDLQLAYKEGARIHAVASRNEGRARAFAQEFGIPNVFSNYEDLLQCPGLDIVYIATPHTFHLEHSLLCLQNRMPVLCEKPCGINTHEVKQILEVAEAKQTFFMEGLWTRFIPSFNKALELVEQGALGAVRSIHADFGFASVNDTNSRLWNRNLGGGSWLDIGIYPAFAAYSLLGLPEHLEAIAIKNGNGIDEQCQVIMSYPNGATASLHSSIVCKTPTECWIHGTEGSLKLNGRWHEPTSITLWNGSDEPKDIFFDYDCHGYLFEIKAVMNALRVGKKQCDEWSWKDSLQLCTLLDAVRWQAGIVYPAQDRHLKKEPDLKYK